MLFDVDRDALMNVGLVEDAVRMPGETARQYGFRGERLDFLVRVGLPNSAEYELSFGLPPEFDPGFIWDCAEEAERGWTFPAGVKKLVKIGNFPVNAVVVDPETGVVYQYTDASKEAIPVHGDLSSLAKTVISFLGCVESYSPDDDEDDDAEYIRRKREVDELTAGIRLVDPLPFAHEYSEWVELFDNLEGGLYF
ncbi:SUKH-4 family immunity protein [Streptomyces sp. NPDC006332]|uniref:SUKH-4 family immunity protein n=1 Tax=Streptomyces sp. NPDC006332 TaxID=3155456 RepID=UPI0033BAAF10